MGEKTCVVRKEISTPVYCSSFIASSIMDSFPLVNSIVLLLLGVIVGGYLSRNSTRHPSQPLAPNVAQTSPPIKHGDHSETPIREDHPASTTHEDRCIRDVGESHSGLGGRGAFSLGAKIPKPKCIRISGIPKNCSQTDLLVALQTLDPPLKEEQCNIWMYPACYGNSQTALYYINSCTGIKLNESTQTIHTASGSEILTFDDQFYDLTPLNTPVDKILAELIICLQSHQLSFMD